VHQRRHHTVHGVGIDVAAFAFLGAAAAVSATQAVLLTRDATKLRALQAGRLTDTQPVSYVGGLLALIDLAVLAVATLVLLAVFAERGRGTRWTPVVWVLILVACVLEWRLMGLRLTAADDSSGIGTDYSGQAREAGTVVVLCAAALAATAVALRRARAALPGDLG